MQIELESPGDSKVIYVLCIHARKVSSIKKKFELKKSVHYSIRCITLYCTLKKNFCVLKKNLFDLNVIS